MKLLIKQRVFSWTDSYDVYDEMGNVRYFVKAEFFTLGHLLHVYDPNQKELGVVSQKLFTLLPIFEMEVGGVKKGEIRKKFSFVRPQYEIDYRGWHVEGNFLGWDYNVYGGGALVACISKQVLSWGDTYVIDFKNPGDELDALLLVIAIDAANCTENRS